MAQENTKMKVVQVDGITVVVLADQKILDEVSIAKIGNDLGKLITPGSKPKIIINFENVTNMSSSALGMLITLHKRVREAGGQLRLCNIQPTISEVFKITRLDEIFQICRDQNQAMVSIGS
jgi:anti-sigma B factor antagonist